MQEDRRAQIVHHPLADLVREQRLDHAEGARHDRDRDHPARVVRESGRVVPADRLEDVLEQERGNDPEPRRDDDQQEDPAEPPPLRIVSSRAAALRPVAPPPSRGAAADASDVAFVSRTRGFLAVAAADAHWDGSGTGRIEGTGDGGVTWTTVWSRARTAVT